MLGIVGLPLPDEIMMTFIGYLASIGQLNLVFTFLSAVTGSICGITVSYYIWRQTGLPLFKAVWEQVFHHAQTAENDCKSFFGNTVTGSCFLAILFQESGM